MPILAFAQSEITLRLAQGLQVPPEAGSLTLQGIQLANGRCAGNPFAYFPQQQIEEQDDEDITRMVAEYDPTQEFVVVLLKRDGHVSTYRVGIVPPGSQGTMVAEDTPDHAGESAEEPELEPPDVETLIAWEAEGGCEAACPHPLLGRNRWGLPARQSQLAAQAGLDLTPPTACAP